MACADQSPIDQSREPTCCPAGSLMLQCFLRSYMSLRYQRARGTQVQTGRSVWWTNRNFAACVDFALVLYLNNSEQRHLHVLVYRCV
jgi:hypothetical protein